MRPSRIHRGNALLLPLLVAISAVLAYGVPAHSDAPKRRTFIGNVADTGQFLAPDVVIARVGSRAITVFRFRDGYYASDPQIRPRLDSLGRREFLDNMIKKEVLGQAALAAGYQLGFEERADLRAFRNTVLSNQLFQREVKDSVRITEDSLRHVAKFYQYDQKMRVLYFRDRTEAEQARFKLLRGVTPWSVMAARYAPRLANATNGELDFMKFESLATPLALQLWPLKPGEISPVIVASTGYQLVQVTQRRPRKAPAYESLRSMLKLMLNGASSDARRVKIQEEAKQGMDVKYDTANVVFASKHFRETMRVDTEGLGQTMTFEDNIPDFATEDTSRVLVRWKTGRLTLGSLLHHYSDIPALTRPSINTPERMLDFVDAVMLEPRMLEIAEKRGYDRDSVVVALIDRKREELLVTRMVEDSAFARVTVSKEERRKYYQDHLTGFVTYPRVRYAIVVRHTRAGADSVKALLDAKKTKITDVVHADSLRGEVRSGILESGQDEHVQFEKLLFEELRPGASEVLGPDRTGSFACYHLISFDPGHQLPYEQVEGVIDESVRNIKSEQALNELYERLARRYTIETHPELLMRIRPTDPAGDDD